MKENHAGRARMRLATRLFDTPLLVERAKLDVIVKAVGPEILGEVVTTDAASYSESSDRKPYIVSPDGIATISVLGPLVKRATGMEAWCGMSSYEQIDAEFRDAVADPNIRAIMLDVDSPGGESGGVFDVSETIRSARGKKPVYAVANDMAFSAAYAIASAADKVFVSINGGVGSIGVIAVHCDQSKFDEKVGLKYTAVYAGAKKNDFSPHEPLSDSAEAELKALVDRDYELFVNLVAKNRGLKAAKIRATEAGLFFGQDGVDAGLADAVGNMREAMAELKAKSLGATSVTRLDGAALTTDAAVEIVETTQSVVQEVESESNSEVSVAAPATNSTEEVVQMNTNSNAGAEVKTEAPETNIKTEEEVVNDDPNKKPEPAAAAQPARVIAKAEEVIELCAIAGKPSDFALGLIGQKLTIDEVRQKLLADRKSLEAAASRINNGTPVMGAGLATLEQQARAKSQASGRTYEQEYADLLMSNKQFYGQYLAANPAQVARR